MPEWLATSKMWSDTFVVGAPIAEKILRPILVYVFLVVALRVFGKRELAQLNPFDLVVLLSLSNTVQNAIIGNDNSLYWRPDRRPGAVGAELPRSPLSIPPSPPRRDAGRPTDAFDRKWQGQEECPGQGVADHSRTHDGFTSPGVRNREGCGALHSRAWGNVRCQGSRSARGKEGTRRSHDRSQGTT